ncbi:MAG: formylmethanofuran dehydrogenase subunit C [Methanoculleaceae archaeon]
MATVTLTLKDEPDLFLEADSITPDAFAGRSAGEISDLPVYQGNQKLTISDWFDVTGAAGATAEDTKIIVKGDTTRVKWLGSRMTAGEVLVEGNLDMYAGAFMAGGVMTVRGNVDAFAGIGMTGGNLVIEGNAGNYLGSAYRGDWRGMQGGTIRVYGDAGSDIGTYINGGEIIVHGNTDVHVGTHAEGGTIIIKGDAKSRVGGQMVKGEIYVFGDIEVMMPGFAYRDEVDLEVDGETAKFARYEGDLGERHPKRKGRTIYGQLYLKC